MTGDRPPAPVVHPSVEDPVVGALSEAVGGPAGTRVRPRGGRGDSWWGPLRVLLALTALSFALGLVAKSVCVEEQWRGDTQFSHVCSPEIAEAYTDTSLVEATWPWSGDAATLSRRAVLEEPALTGLWAYGAARLAHVLAGSPDGADRTGIDSVTLLRDPDVRRERVVFVAVNAAGLALLALLTTLALSRVHRRRPWDAAGFALSPLLILTGLTAWDLLAVSAVALALLAWSRRRPVLAGVLVGLGAAAGVWPALLLGAFVLAAPRAPRTPRLPDVRPVVLPAVAAALATWALVNAPAFVSGREQWERFWEVAADRGPDSGTLWTIVDATVGVSHSALLLTSWLLVGLWVAGVVAISLLAPVPPRASQAALLLVAGFVLLRPAFEPHQALWLLPLAALARPRWRDLLIWQSCAVFFAAMHSWWLGGLLDPGGDGLPAFYYLAIVIHLAGTLWLVAVVVGDVWWPEVDPVAEERAGQVTTMRSNDVVV